MSEYWKSTPKYWCKHCSCYVRDTKIERSNHEATARHQGAIKRSLRDIHRNHEREEREKERARQEIARLNGVVGGSSSSSGPSGFNRRDTPQSKQAAPSESQLKTQREQLASLGVSMPSDFRPEMAIPGEWTVTSTTVVQESNGLKGEDKVEAKAIGVRKREETEEQKAEEEAMRGLFKKAKKWGRDSKTMPLDEDEELNALLSGPIALKRDTEEEDIMGKTENEDETNEGVNVKAEEISIKHEPDVEPKGIADMTANTSANVKEESPKDIAVKAEEEEESTGLAPIVFKQRKPKKLRSK